MLSITPHGEMIEVSRLTTGDSVAMDSAGRIGVVHQSVVNFYTFDGDLLHRYAGSYSGIAASPEDGFVAYVEATTKPPAVDRRDAMAQRFRSDGTLAEQYYLLNEIAAGRQVQPDVAMGPNGNYVATWYDADQENGKLEYRVFNQNGPLTAELQAYNQFAVVRTLVGMARNGDFAIAPASCGCVQFYASDGIPQATVDLGYSPTQLRMLPNGDVIVGGTGLEQVSPNGDRTSLSAQVSDLAPMNDGGFLGVSANYDSVTVQRFDDGGQLIDQTTISLPTANVSFPQIATDGDRRAVVTWGDRFTNGRAQFLSLDGHATQTFPLHLRAEGADQHLAEGGRIVYRPDAIAMDFNGGLLDGDPADPFSPTNPANWRLLRDGADVSSLIASVTVETRHDNDDSAVLHFTEALEPGNYEIVALGSMQSEFSEAIDGDYDATPGGDFTRSFVVSVPTASGPEKRLNAFTHGDQRTSPASLANVAMRDDGSFLTTWASDGQDGSGWGVYARPFDDDLNALRTDTLANVTTAGDQRFSTAAAQPDGRFLVTWSDNGRDGDGYGVYMRRFNATGAPNGDDFRVNQTTAGDQSKSSIAVDLNGDFVVTWESKDQDGFGYGVYARRFLANGTAKGPEFLVNQTVLSDQRLAGVAMSPGGEFVVTWTSFNQDGSGDGVYARRYAADGNPLGNEFRVNTTTLSTQRQARVAMDPDGDFAVTWTSANQDGNSYGVYAQRFESDGTPRGSEFRVNQTTNGEQTNPVIGVDDFGNFVVAWASNNQDGSGFGIYARRYNAAGVPDGNEFRVNTTTIGQQNLPSIGVDADGDFTIVWNSVGQDGDGFGVYAQRFSTNSRPVADAGGTYRVQEGSSLALNAGLSSDPDVDDLTFSWDLNGDGVFGDASGISPTVTWQQLRAVGINDGPALWTTVTVRTTDELGNTDTDVTTIEVLNTAPTVEIGGANTGGEGALTPYALTLGPVNDPGADTISLWTVEWGDGSIDTYNTAGVVTHAYLQSQLNYTIKVTATDEDGTYSPVLKVINVTNVAPRLANVVAAKTTENAPTLLRGQIIDPGVEDSFTLDIYWGDSPTPQTIQLPAGTTVFEVPHLYPDDPAGPPPDEFPIDMLIRDSDGGQDTESIRVTVANVAPAAPILGVLNQNPVGELVVLSTNVSDPGPLDTFTYAWRVELNGALFASGNAANFSFTPTETGHYFVQLTVTDDDSGVFTDSAIVRVPGGEAVPGDTNGDGLVDLVDLNNVRNNFGGNGPGDTNDDGIVDLEDLNAVRNNFGGGGAPALLVTKARPTSVEQKISPAAIDAVVSLLGEGPEEDLLWNLPAKRRARRG